MLYPELCNLMPLDCGERHLLWHLNEELGSWFYLLRGYSQARKRVRCDVACYESARRSVYFFLALHGSVSRLESKALRAKVGLP